MDLLTVIIAIQHNWLYFVALAFFAGYPIASSIVWISTAFFFRLRWEKLDDAMPRLLSAGYMPPVSVLITAYNEAHDIAESLTAACAIDYPYIEVVVVNDGSTDGTLAEIEPFVRDGRVRLLNKTVNEGKAMALNDALPVLNGDVILMMDADAEPEPDILQHMVPHFASARVAAVTGNPRVKNINNFLTRLQLLEFSSIISLLRRAQRVWGRIATVSGVVVAFRKSAVYAVGGFSPDMATEDIEMTWKLQKNFWDVRYEPHALVWMKVPSTLRGLFRQRMRWARGLMQVLRKHNDVPRDRRFRRMWPMFYESVLSILWAICFVVLTTLWAISYGLGYPPVGAHPIPNFWGMTIATAALLQLFTGAAMDRSYDRPLLKYYGYAVWYPIIYWTLMAVTSVLSLHWLLRKPSRRPVRWRTVRQPSPAKELEKV